MRFPSFVALLFKKVYSPSFYYWYFFKCLGNPLSGGLYYNTTGPFRRSKSKSSSVLTSPSLWNMSIVIAVWRPKRHLQRQHGRILRQCIIPFSRCDFPGWCMRRRSNNVCHWQGIGHPPKLNNRWLQLFPFPPFPFFRFYLPSTVFICFCRC